jgi:hypothetical protein
MKDKYGQPITKDGYLDVGEMKKYDNNEWCHHEKVKIKYKSYNEFIDVKIAPLIYEMIKADISIFNSCQNDDTAKYTTIWLHFASEDDILDFLKIIYDETSNYDEMLERANPLSNTKNSWDYNIFINTDNYTDEDKWIFVHYSIRFKKNDYEFALRKLHEYNNPNQKKNTKMIKPKDNKKKKLTDKYGQPITKDGYLNIDLMEKIEREYNEHKEVNLYYNHWDTTVEIDVGIAPLIYEMWKVGIYTNNCCESNMTAQCAVDEKDPECEVDYAWICFDGDHYLHKFLTIVFNNMDHNEDIYKRAFDIGDPRFKWRYDIHVDNDYDQITNHGNRDLYEINNSLRFPEFDYEFILNKFYEYNKLSVDYLSDNDICSSYEDSD